MSAKILYIVGGGHSGSTLLDLILGSAEEVASLGEVYFYNSYTHEHADEKLYSAYKGKCSCGSDFLQCAFWNDVRQEAKKDISISRRFKISDNFKVLWNIYQPFSKKFSLQLREDDNALFFNSVERVLSKQRGEIKYLLDSSKDPRRLVQLLQTVDSERLIIIHLVRDGRGYVNSYTNQKSWRIVEGGLKTENFLLVALRWIIVNCATRRLLKRFKLKNIHISYDLFCQDPENYINVLNQRLDINIPDNFLQIINTKKYHNIHGNLLKFKKIESIKYDKKWEQNLSYVKKTILTVILSIFNRRFVCADDINKGI